MKPSIALQYLLPHQLLTRVVYWATRRTWKPWKNFLIGQIVRRFNVDLSEAQTPDPAAFEHFNAFFTRLLKPGARSADPAPEALLCPADGKVSQSGPIRAGRILQAKGQDYSVAELLASEEDAAAYADGSFVTVYLSPRDYHRAHMPLTGTLLSTVHVPGRLFSVAPVPVEAIPRLFARNERLVCHFQGEHGRFVVVMVGAMLVSSVSTVWSGLEIPPYARRVTRKDWRDQQIRLERFAEMARFNMGSTVIVLLPPGVGAVADTLVPQQAVKVGERIGTLSA
jgi:phosphatidylserine decarboxylase